MDRRTFLKQVGLGSAALASVSALEGVASADENDDPFRFYFVALSGQADALNLGDSIAMSGKGTFSESGVQGRGEFVHFDGTQIPSTDFIATGWWRATELIGFQQIGQWGILVPGVLDLEVKLRPCDGPAIHGATLRIVCNLGPPGILTSPFQQEGYTLTVPGLEPFEPFTPNIGLTVFSTHCPDEADGA